MRRRRIITIAIIAAVAAITTAWSMSISGSANKPEARFGGSSLVPTHTHLLW